MADNPEMHAAQTPETATVKLGTPIVRKELTIDTLTLTKPKGGALRGLGLKELINGDINTIIAVLPRITQPFITEHEVEQLEADDLAELGGVVVGFFMTRTQRQMVDRMVAGSQ